MMMLACATTYILLTCGNGSSNWNTFEMCFNQHLQTDGNNKWGHGSIRAYKALKKK
jgi:hypothetical protein